jgi:hypothetical protein
MIAMPRRISNPMMIRVESGTPVVVGPVTGTTTVETTVETIVGIPIVGTTVSCAVTDADAFNGAKAANAKAENTISVRIENRFNMFLSFLGEDLCIGRHSFCSNAH